MSEKTQNKKSETALREEEVLKLWKENTIFEKSLEKEAPKGEFVFYDGPPFATGLPHYGTLLSSVIKDVIGRYKTMQGYYVPRRWGWDCHGLPIEHMIENKLGLKTKKDIEVLGIDKFNEEAKNSVLAYVDEWRDYVSRIGRWVDFDNSYKTMDNSYIESVWWALKKIHTDKRLYEGKKVLMYCPRCETPLSKAEIAMDNSYKDVTDEATFVKFRVPSSEFKARPELVEGLKADKPVYILAWTTTPWTLPANMALAIGSEIEYLVVTIPQNFNPASFDMDLKIDPGSYVFAREAAQHDKTSEKILLKLLFLALNNHVPTKHLKGSELVGLSYEPLYEIEKAKSANSEKAWTVLAADFVTTEDGTGVVHIAPMYGEDDYALGQKNNLPVIPLLDGTGTYNADAPKELQGMYYKKGGKYVMEDLEKRNLLFAKHNHTHSYPHCYRCGTALIYNALTSWFIDIQSVKKRLLEANEEVNWYPEHLKHGRFKNIVETAPDWTISRNRFWASPLPIWKHEKTGEIQVFGSLAELRERTKKSGNTYLFLRHGEAESNIEHVISSLPENTHKLTEKGKEQLRTVVSELKEKGVTKIITSPLLRTKESAELVAQEIGFDAKNILVEDRFKEWQLGDLNGKPVADLQKVCPSYKNRFEQGCGTGETLKDMKRRVGEALYELEETYKNETILVVAHEYTVWFAECVALGAAGKECVAIRGKEEDFVANAEYRVIDFVPLPHNKEYELDLHRPYIDTLELLAEDGARLIRTPEVVDCWVESGSMPFASEHYPHENKEVVTRRYPGDFITEYIAQTRTWFYYMHAMGVLLFDAPCFKNCVTTGTLLAADGAKISKSKKNFTDPYVNIDLYGADAMRFYMMGSVVMSAEDAAFKDDELREAHNRFINMIWNSYKFYEMNVGTNAEKMSDIQKLTKLDEWVLARLGETVQNVTRHMDEYDSIRSARTLREFVTDLSTWYIRRSRDRFKSEDADDGYCVRAVSREVFLTLAKLIAPLTPYIAESLYKGVGGNVESVHLEVWPTNTQEPNMKIIEDMAEIRRIASLALEVRQRTGIKVRQPLAKMTLSTNRFESEPELLAILCDEINVKECVVDASQKEEVVLDTELTDTLRQEGMVRDIVRAVQDMRKKAGLMPEDAITLTVQTDTEGEQVLELARAELARVAGVKEVVFGTPAEGTTLKIETSEFLFAITKN
jgi:isoleucyl-tRNA synthetase